MAMFGRPSSDWRRAVAPLCCACVSLVVLGDRSLSQGGPIVEEEDLYRESASDFDAFIQKYSGRDLAIRGKVLNVVASDYVDSYVRLDQFVTCYTSDSQKALLPTLEQRDTVVVRGTISESFLGRVYLRPCAVETAAPVPPPDMAGMSPPLGKYECWSWSQAQLTLAFTLASGGVYLDYRGAQGRYSYDGGTRVVTMRGQTLDGQQLRFSIDPRPQLTFRKPDGSFDFGIACDWTG
jgi:hypothetical protein